MSRGWNIVLVGAWNPAIFSPVWIGQHLLQLPTEQPAPVEVSIPIGASGQMRLSFPDQKFVLLAEHGRILFSPLTRDNSTLASIESLAIRLLRTLGHTPISAVGVNYLFRQDAPVEHIDAVFSLPDAGRLAALSLHPSKTEIIRSLSGIEGYGRPILNLNFSSRIAPSSLQINFNYHYAVDGAAEAAERLAGAFPALSQHAAQVLAKYGVTIEEDEGDDHE